MDTTDKRIMEEIEGLLHDARFRWADKVLRDLTKKITEKGYVTDQHRRKLSNIKRVMPANEVSHE